MTDTTAWDHEASQVFRCPDCIAPATVHSHIDGDTRRIAITKWHSPGCPNRGGRLAWSAEAAVSIGEFPWGRTRTTA